ncbi:TPA: hypothetical protein PWU38_002021 [Mannheimia haemolytica]|uniref:hypothetical protein n=1 Tax=Mannheimia haemolytica TaxID=75985 RepID=UPI00077EC26A|nr:hypothetical protein [Mannheimia haemolytica]KYL07385.1 hypothetical protein AC568_08750 [Mannheimia haemolytica]UFK43485.1 hypothetical protein LO774_04605 [Mannheimia haemolytica]HDL1113666.1 hypothetical protein [Mannheimia haemolytica]HDL1116117.1 hypothetical protein [Mannheimia haemolytica]HDL1124299.1 hypothetical protein [Mannheimia haemolytica]
MSRTLLAFAISCAFLTACSSPTQPQVEDPNMLPAGTLQPIEGSGSGSGSGASQDSYSWPSDIQSTSMPDSMK